MGNFKAAFEAAVKQWKLLNMAEGFKADSYEQLKFYQGRDDASVEIVKIFNDMFKKYAMGQDDEE